MTDHQLDSLADSFDDCYFIGKVPSLKEYIARVPETQQDKLLELLIPIEIEYLIKAGAMVRAENYRSFGESAVRIAEHLIDDGKIKRDGETDHGEARLETVLTLTSGAGLNSGDLLGRYKLIEPIGEGGMGAVWKAEQIKPIRRFVAIKVIRADMSHHQAIARFDVERQALALMDHENIARVFDASVTETGNPYFVMELVDGIPIKQYCDRHQLGIKERVQLIADVCKGVQHAHQKGIVHRDLKPANILVGEQDGRAVPKVIDFGLAKALDHTTKLTDKTMNTQMGQILGTLQYMSPEQAELSQTDVDTRTDVYSLGVVLYELLTGETPLMDETLADNSIGKVLEIIRTRDVARPSMRLHSIGKSVESIAELRKTSPSKLKHIMQIELDWVLLKALERDRDRRYESVTGFADDLMKFVRDEPVEAGPPSAVYRVRKFVKKYRGLVAALATILLLLIGGIIGTSWGFLSAKREAEIARLNFSVAHEAVNNYISTVSNNPRLDEEDYSDLKKNLLDSTKPFLDALSKNANQFQEAELTRAVSNKLLGIIQQETGEFEKASASLQLAVEQLTRLLENDATVDSFSELANVELALANLKSRLGQPIAAIDHIHESHKAMNAARTLGYNSDDADWFVANSSITLGSSLGELDRRREAIEQYEKSARMARQFIKADLKTLKSREMLATALTNSAVLRRGIGETDRARKDYHEAIDLLSEVVKQDPKNPELLRFLADSQAGLAGTMRHLGQISDSKILVEKSVAVRKRLVETFPKNPNYKMEYADSLFNNALMYTETDQQSRAIELLNESKNYSLRLIKQFPEISAYQSLLSSTYGQLASINKTLGKDAAAIENYGLSIDLQRKLAEIEPSVSEHRFDLAIALNNLGNLIDQQGDQKKGLARLTDGEKILKSLAAEFPDVDRNQLHLGKTRNNLGNIYLNTGEFKAAIEWYELAAVSFTKLIEKQAFERQSIQELSKSKNNLAVICLRTGQLDQALNLLESCRDLRAQLTQKFPDVEEYRSDLSNVLHNLMAINASLEKMDEALSYGQESLKVAASTASAFPQVEKYQANLTNSLSNLAALASRIKRDEIAIEYFRRADDEFQILASNFSERPSHYGHWATCLDNLALLHWYRSELSDAAQAARKSITQIDRALAKAPQQVDFLKQKVGSLLTLARIETDIEPKKAAQLLEQVITMAGKFTEKQPKLETAVTDLSDALALRSRFHMKNGDLDLAIDDLEKAKEHSPDRRLNLDTRIEILRMRKKMRDQLSRYESGELQPENIKERLALAQEFACDRHQKFELAINHFKKFTIGDFEKARGADPELAWVEAAECALKLASRDETDLERKVEYYKMAHELLNHRLNMLDDKSETSWIEAGVWLRQIGLAPSRDTTPLEFLPELEQKAWETLWMKVRKLAQRTPNA